MSRKLSDVLDFGGRLEVGQYGKSKVINVESRVQEVQGKDSVDIIYLLIELTEGTDAGTEHTVTYRLAWYNTSKGGEFSPGFTALKRDAKSLGILDKLPDDLPELTLPEIRGAVARAFKGVNFRFKVVAGKPVKRMKPNEHGDLEETTVTYNETFLMPLGSPEAKPATATAKYA